MKNSSKHFLERISPFVLRRFLRYLPTHRISNSNNDTRILITTHTFAADGRSAKDEENAEDSWDVSPTSMLLLLAVLEMLHRPLRSLDTYLQGVKG